MIFTWLNKQGVRCSEGFEFQFTGRFTAEYRENGKTTEFYVESGSGVVTIYEGSISKFWRSYSSDTSRADERDRIISNIRLALEFQELQLDFVNGNPPRS